MLKYSGDPYIYILFSISAHFLLYSGFRRQALFFDTFIGIFIWLGFWLKHFFVIMIFQNTFEIKAYRFFDGSTEIVDQSLLVSTFGIAGFLLASYFRSNYLKFISFNSTQSIDYSYHVYIKYKKYILASLILMILTIALFNYNYSIYQRGMVANYVLPYKLNGVITWLLLFGFATFVTIIIQYEIKQNKCLTLQPIVLNFLESFISNVSILSRGMLLNSLSVFLGAFKYLKINHFIINKKILFQSCLVFSFAFMLSLYVVSSARSTSHSKRPINNTTYVSENVSHLNYSRNFQMLDAKKFFKKIYKLVVNRWIGIEGVVVVTSYPEKGGLLFKRAWGERYKGYGTSFYDQTMINSPYSNIDTNKHHFVSIPGIIAFLFYTGSTLFVIVSTFLIGIVMSFAEYVIYKLTSENIILCSLLSQVIAYRLCHFGYVPAQSYLLFGAIILNVFLIYMINKLIYYFFNKQYE